MEQSFRLAFLTSNNEAEYETLIAGLRLTKDIRVKNTQAYCDSQLVANKFSGEYDAILESSKDLEHGAGTNHEEDDEIGDKEALKSPIGPITRS